MSCIYDDPNDLDWFPERRIYGDDRGEVYAIVDEEDYQWALQWRWSPKWSRGGRKFYLRRSERAAGRGSKQRTVWLHVEIMKRKGKRQRTALHKLVDHIDGDGLNCRRNNLRWATHTMNNRNR